MSIQFTAQERLAVTAMSFIGRTQETVARDSGLSLSSFKKAMDASEELRDAWLIGKAMRLELRIGELESQSKKGSTRATELLLRFEHRIAPPQSSVGGRGDINININAESIAKAVDGRTYSAALLRVQHDPKTPALIEHDATTQPVDIDPIESVKRRQRLEKHAQR